MVAKVVLDTDILSEIYKNRNPVVTEKALTYLENFDKLSVISVTSSEFLFGFHVKNAESQLVSAKKFLKANEEIVPTSADYWLFAEIRAGLKKIGRPIGEADPMIAACVFRRNLTLATGNIRHYQYVINAGFNIQLVD